MTKHNPKITWLSALALAVVCAILTPNIRAEDIESMPPVVVKTVPEAGLKDVASGTVDIKITFSKERRIPHGKDRVWLAAHPRGP